MIDWYYQTRDEIINRIIRFLLKHCAIHSLTLRQTMQKVEWQHCEAIVNDIKKKKLA